MKFSLIISNPPYNQNLDLKILKEIYDLSEKICFVHPFNYALNNKQNYSKIYDSIRKYAKKHLKEYYVVDDANRKFGIYSFNSIYYVLFDNTKEYDINLDDIDIHGNSEIYKSIKHKVIKYSLKNNCWKECDFFKNKYNNEYKLGLTKFAPSGRDVMIQKTNENAHIKCGFSAFRPGLPGRIFEKYTFIKLTDESAHIGKTTKYDINFSFETIDEAINFKDYLKTKIARFCLSIFKVNQTLISGELAGIPYMPTYTHPWTDEDVAKELGLTDEELAWAINWIPDYYPEDAEKYAKWKKMNS